MNTIQYWVIIHSVSDPVCFRPDPCFEKSRIRIPDIRSGSFKFCESISLEYRVVICRFIGKRACQTLFYSVRNILSTRGWFSTHPILSFNKKYENFKLILLRIFVGIRIRDPGVQTGSRSGSQIVKIPGSDRIRIRNTDYTCVHCTNMHLMYIVHPSILA